jgi:hypothetical protein
MKIYICLEDAPLGGVDIKVMRVGEANNHDLNSDTPANEMAKDLEARMQQVIAAGVKMSAKRREQIGCLH